jgi:ABC-type transporter MlaC component
LTGILVSHRSASPRGIAAAFVAAILTTFALLTPNAASAQNQAAINVAERLASQAHSAIRQGNIGGVERAVSASFNFGSWEQFLIGNDGDRFSGAQRAQFRRLLPAYLARLYADQFKGGLDREPVISGSRAARGDILVSADVPRSRGRAIKVDYRIRGNKVIDFMVGGVSFLLLKRDEFGAILKKPDGAAELISFLRQYTGQA